MAATFSHDTDDNGILRILFDSPGEKVNTLNATILRDLDALLDQARDDRDVRGVMFASDKPGMFIAGMDIEQIASVGDALQGAEGARQGQAVFQKIADLGKPSVAAIRGTCLGGGLELSLACDFRVASNDSKTRIGLPEVQLGIIPGFGGTQRFPHRAGLLASLDLILSGRGVDGRKAKKLFLVDVVVAEAYVEREARKLLQRAIDEGRDKVKAAYKPRHAFVPKLMSSFGPLRGYAMKQAEKKVAARARKEHYPGPYKAIEAIEAAYTKPIREGLDIEARLIGELIPSPTAQNLMWLFKSSTALKGDRGVSALPRKIRRVGVLGAGVMGGGIAQLAADKELPVRLKDINFDAVLTALQTASKVWSKKVKRRRLSKNGFARKIGNISPTLDTRGFKTVDIVIEAVVERLDIKQAVLAELETVLDERAVFASNTSSIPISDIAAKARHPERVVGMHFFNPVHKMPLIEIIAGRHTSPEAIATVHDLTIKMGKVPVVVKDSPGFLVNRILTLYLLESMLLLERRRPDGCHRQGDEGLRHADGAVRADGPGRARRRPPCR